MLNPLEDLRDVLTDDQLNRIYYAVGHIQSAQNFPEDAHASDSMDLGWEVLTQIFNEVRDSAC